MAVHVHLIYHPSDDALRRALLTHLSPLQARCTFWSAEQVEPGAALGRERDQSLSRAEVVLVLVSARLVADPDCCSQVEAALRVGALVVPVLLSPSLWRDLPFGRLQPLPRGGQPVSQWSSQDDALLHIAEALRDSLEPPAAGGTAVRGQGGAPAGVFVGRERELAALARALVAAEESTQALGGCAVQGMAGVGKSYLCDRFYALHAGHFPGGYLKLSWAPTEQPAEEGVLAGLAERLGILGPPARRVEALRQRLAAPRTLVHIENVDGEEQARAAGRVARRLVGLPVLVSGRYRGLGQAAGWPQIEVLPLSEDAAYGQLCREFRPSRDAAEEAEYRRLVRQAAGLPLTVHLCAGHLRAGRPVRGFVGRLAQRVLDLTVVDPADPLADAPERALLRASFGQSWELLRTQLGAMAEAWLPGLAAFGHVPPGGVGAGLGAAVCGLPAEDFEELMVAARALSLVRLDEAAVGRDVWQAHPLLGSYLRQQAQPPAGAGGLTGLYGWFLPRLRQPELWPEVNLEQEALAYWLEQAPLSAIAVIERAGTYYGWQNGPYGAWAGLCERGLTALAEEQVRSDLLQTLGLVCYRAGELERALQAFRHKAELERRRGDPREVALTLEHSADVHQARGELDEALRILREECLPVFQRLGDLRRWALMQRRIAGIHQARGELDEALRILREECLPVFQQLSDTSTWVRTLAQIADIYRARGELDEALRILREACLPVLKDTSLRAHMLGRSADILQARGELDEALRIFREECLPVFQQQGDLAAQAIVLGRIADLHEARGELDEALRVYQEDALPAYERLGARGDSVTGRRKLGLLLRRRGLPGDQESAQALLESAYQDALVLHLPEAEQLRRLLLPSAK